MGGGEKIIMWKLVGPSCVLLAACATGAGFDHAPTPLSVRFAAEDLEPTFPAAKNPQLPSADRISGVIKSELGPQATADVKLCVTPDGHVQAVELVRGSSLTAFDQAVLHDTAEWQFSGLPGNGDRHGNARVSNLRTCGVTTITYRPHP
jgi:TonB family protein